MNGTRSNPLIAIVGRPNVGKSAIFNRLAGRRIAIVHEQSGVTRDRLVCAASWGGARFDLVDTGGLANVRAARPADEIEAGVKRQVDAVLADASVVLLVVDAEAGILPLDEEVAALLHRSGVRTLTAVNKCDNPERDALSSDFAPFGFPAFPVSALHDRGFDALMAEALRGLPEAPAAEAVPRLKVAVVGRPNAGKSSFINRLLRAERLIVSDVPGTTIDSIDIPFTVGDGPDARHYLLTDTAGLRPSSKIQTSIEHFSLMRTEASIRNADVVALILDAQAGPTKQDKKIAAMVLDHHRGCVLLVTKWDLAKGIAPREYESAMRRELPFLDHAPIVFVSSVTGFNIRKTLEVVDRVAVHVRSRLPTGVLNRTVMDASDRQPPPLVAGRRLRIYYATQPGIQPIRIALFVNYPERLLPAYRAFLIRCLRETFGLDGAPIVLEPKAKLRKDE